MAMRKILKSKIHRATVTDADLDYEGSCTIDEELMELADIAAHEMVLISNLNNGERLETYVIPGKRGSGTVCLNGAAARKGMKGDKVIIISTRYVDEDEISRFRPRIIRLTDQNRPQD